MKKTISFLLIDTLQEPVPKCNYDSAYGDQCENCGSTLSPNDLINPKSAISGEVPVKKNTKHWYLPLQNHQKRLENYVESHTDWKSNVYGQCKSWLDQGLQSRAMTRDLDWGIQVPLKDAEGKVLYVWFDAPIGYISMTKEWAEEQGDAELWISYWKNPECELIHFIGKDNIVFHAIIFPAILMAANDGFKPADNVPANEFLNLEGDKLSTSRNYAVWAHEYLEKFDVDSLRFYLTSILPENKDSDFSWKQFQSVHNGDLADTIGNFINRSVTFTHKFFDGKVPDRNDCDDLDKEAIDYIQNISDRVGDSISKYQFRKALEQTMEFARFANKYFNDQQPWKTRNDAPTKCATTLNICLHICYKLAILLRPFIPSSAQKILDQLKLDSGFEWNHSIDIDTGHEINSPTILFAKIEDEQIDPEIERLEQIKKEKSAMNYQALADQIGIEDFNKIDLRLAKILEVEAVPKAKKLLKIIVDLGFEKRQIVSGIAEFYQPKDLVGKQVVVVANLKPVKLRGVESNGMLLAIQSSNGELEVLQSESDLIGSVVR